MIVDEPYARDKHLKIGSTLTLIAHQWHVTSIYEPGKLAWICVKLSALQQFTDNPHHLSQIYLKVDDPNRAQAVVDALRAKYPGYPIYTLDYYTSLLSVNSLGLLRNFTYVVIGVAMIVGSHRRVHGNVHRRFGANKGDWHSEGGRGLFRSLIMRETLLLAVSGTVVGILLTYVTQWLIVHVVPDSLTQETVYAWWPIAAAIAIIGALIGAIIPGLRAVRQDATEALSYK